MRHKRAPTGHHATDCQLHADPDVFMVDHWGSMAHFTPSMPHFTPSMVAMEEENSSMTE